MFLHCPFKNQRSFGFRLNPNSTDCEFTEWSNNDRSFRGENAQSEKETVARFAKAMELIGQRDGSTEEG
jgi:hypothetical protein